jgi:hypothetical protein
VRAFVTFDANEVAQFVFEKKFTAYQGIVVRCTTGLSNSQFSQKTENKNSWKLNTRKQKHQENLVT